MTITVCERGCGRTSLDPDSAIEKMSVRARQNGTEESSFDNSIEACKPCRELLHEMLMSAFMAQPLMIAVSVVKGKTRE